MKKNHYYKTGVDICSAKSMFNFLNNHYTYYTLNSWNGLKSIANRVKIYDLCLDATWETVFNLLADEDDCSGLQFKIAEMINNWECDHPDYKLGFNGRSCGYLVIYNKDNYGSILPCHFYGCDTYEEWKELIREGHYDCVKDHMSELREYTELVRSFDRLCDDLRELVNDFALNANC